MGSLIRTMASRILLPILLGTLLVAGCSASTNQDDVNDRPNILLIVADDLGYSDLGVHGSDIATPNIDSLAREGVLFTQFHTATMCAPTRAMLFSGNNNHVAGMARQSRRGLAGHDVPGYEASLSDRIMPFPKLLRDSGYRTYTVGKWHLGTDSEHSPRAAGFERSFSLLHGAGTHFNSIGFYEGGSEYRSDGELVDWPKGRYSTDLYTDKLIEFIDAGKQDGKPFFAFAAYTSPHWPLQVPDDYLDLYSGRYDAGYDVLREENFKSLKAAGIIPATSELPPHNDVITPWQELGQDEQRYEARKMELYAAMVDNLDDHVGRLLGYLRDNDLYENTIILFMSDNGAAPGDYYNWGSSSSYVREHHDNAYEKMGTEASFVAYGIPWAQAGSAPFKRYKTYTTEGGMTAPLIVTGPGIEQEDSIRRPYATVMDLAPTFLELAGATYPDDGSVEPMLGESMLPFLHGESEQIHDDQYVTTMSHWGRTFLRQGKWKIVTLEPPFDESKFELFDLSVDPGETTNLAEAESEKYAELIDLWRSERRRFGIILPEDL